ncbi:hypothetical protein BJ138DRAFT_1122328 [Hygrophoropsis aurantiaca]|uniref:Uncharacterized protein n=1 Tax=Hygrophoropsis aurantiaca TaxID=72124 RepID=A0ACB8ASR8_9AGAM|nr:hypothetical protein BJ138DRAFT_1122328 [Hygrophoropsis aurantiaca]
MVEPSARIRPYRPSDEKLVKFILGKSTMEGLAVANQTAVFHPVTLSIWVALSCIMIQILDWWPKPQYGWLGNLAPLPAFGCWAMPVLYFIDWINRPFFDEAALNTLRRPDMVDIPIYYSRSPSSGFFILEYGDTFVGLIATDASEDSMSDKTVTTNNHAASKATLRVATIRHFYVEEPFRKIKIQNDLLQHAIRHTFEGGTTVDSISATSSPLIEYIRISLQENGFQYDKTARHVGIYGWKVTKMVLKR